MESVWRERYSPLISKSKTGFVIATVLKFRLYFVCLEEFTAFSLVLAQGSDRLSSGVIVDDDGEGNDYNRENVS